MWLVDEKAAIEEVRNKLSKEAKQLEKDFLKMEAEYDDGDVDPWLLILLLYFYCIILKKLSSGNN